MWTSNMWIDGKLVFECLRLAQGRICHPSLRRRRPNMYSSSRTSMASLSSSSSSSPSPATVGICVLEDKIMWNWHICTQVGKNARQLLCMPLGGPKFPKHVNKKVYCSEDKLKHIFGAWRSWVLLYFQVEKSPVRMLSQEPLPEGFFLSWW